MTAFADDPLAPTASIGPEHAPAVPASLSCMPRKRALFGVDTYFRDSWEDACECLGEAIDDFAEAHGCVLVKPDAVASRRVVPVVDWLVEYGATIVAAERCLLTPHVIRAGWQYQWNLATRDRRDLADLLMPTTESLVLVVRRAAADDVPFTVTLSHAKGPADPNERRPGQLRYSLGKENYLLNFVHTADEPADMVRELGILLDAPTRRSVYGAVLDRADAQERAREQAEALYGQVPSQDLSLEGALHRLGEAARARPRSEERKELLATLASVASGHWRDWRGVCELAERAGVDVDVWTTVALGTHLMNAKEAGRVPILDDVTRDDWLEAGSRGSAPTATGARA